MTIKGLTDRGLGFPQIGVIRKGSPKQTIQRDGKDIQIQGKDLKYFRVEFDEEEKTAAETFKKIYGEQPQQLRCTFPFNEIDRAWDAYLEAYTTGRLVARSDGETILWWKEGKEQYIKYGLAVADRTVNIWKKIEGNHTEPLVITMKAGQPVPFVDGMVFHRTEKTLTEARPVGRLRVTLYELKRLGYLLLPTTSINDIIALGGPDSGELGAIKMLCNQLSIPFAGVPLILHRKPKDIAYTDEKGKQGRTKRWLLHIEADPVFVERAFEKSRQLAMPAISLLSGSAESIHGVNEPEETEDDIPEEVIAEAEEIKETKEEKVRFNHGSIVMAFAKTLGLDNNSAAQAIYQARKKDTDPLPEMLTVSEAVEYCKRVLKLSA